jgi:hypothetical protein
LASLSQVGAADVAAPQGHPSETDYT